MRTTAQGLIATFFGRIGGAASFFVFGTVLVGWLGLSWRGAVGVVVVVGVACGVLFLLLFRNTPREHPWVNAAEAELITAGDPEAAVATGSRLRWSALLGSVTVWMLFTRALMSNLADVLYVNWFPLYLREMKGLGEGRAGALAALPLIGGALGGLASGWLQSRLIRGGGGRRLARRAAGGTGKLVAAGLMAASLTLAEPALIALALFAVKFFCDMEQPAEWGTITDVAGRNAATVFACVNTVGSLGGALGGLVIGYVLKAYMAGDAYTPVGWTWVFLIIAIEYLIAAACWLFIDPNKPITPLSNPR
jgi:sugar phosphate permease